MPPFLPDDVDEMPDFGAAAYAGLGEVEDDDEPANVVSDILGSGAHATVVSLPGTDREVNGEPQPIPVNRVAMQLDYLVEEDFEEEMFVDELLGDQIHGEDNRSASPVSSTPPGIAPFPDMGLDDGELAGDELPGPGPAAIITSAKKRGRPSLAQGKTPSKKNTPARSKASPPASASRSSGRKRKAESAEEESAAEPTPAKKKRGRPAAASHSTSARLAAKAAGAPKRGRPAGKSKASTTKSTSSADEAHVPAGEYEVEAILDSAIDADDMQHMYHVKWKGYPVEEATWEPKLNLEHAIELIRAFESRKGKQTRTQKKATRAVNGTAEPKKSKPKPKIAKAAPKAAAPAKKAGRPRGRPRKTAAAKTPAPKSKSKEVKKPGRPAQSSRDARSAARSSGRPRRGAAA